MKRGRHSSAACMKIMNEKFHNLFLQQVRIFIQSGSALHHIKFMHHLIDQNLLARR